MSAPVPRELSPRMRQVGLGAIALAAAAAAVTAWIVAANLITGSAVAVPTALTLLAIPVVFGGQIWVIICLRRVLGQSRLSSAALRRINPMVLGAVAALAFAGWLMAAASAPAGAHGTPLSTGQTCAHVLNTHGTYTCLTEAAYQRNQANDQRAEAGILFGFFAIHVGGGLIARGRSKP